MGSIKDDINDVRSSEIAPTDFKDKKCAPGSRFENGSCIKIDILLKMAEAYNKEPKNTDKIPLCNGLEMLNPGKYKRHLIKEFKNRFSTCKNQSCWTEASFINKLDKITKDELKKYTFRPLGPEGRFEWLNTVNIDEAMKQYEKKYQDFKFLGAIPIDFDELPVLGIKDLDFDKLVKSGKTKIGTVFNLDEHYKAGSHWVALYSDLEKGTVYYFDSYGIIPDKRIRVFVRRICDFIKKDMGKKVTVDYNKVRHQYENSECGVYSMNFIIRSLRGAGFEEITQNKVHDRTINKCRNIYFKNSNIK